MEHKHSGLQPNQEQVNRMCHFTEIAYLNAIIVCIYRERKRVCVCVDHLKRCKTSFVLWLFFGFVGSRGMECASDVSIQRRRICCTVIWIGDAQSTYLLNLSHFRQWRPAKPRTGMSFPVASGPSSELLYQQVQYTVRFSQSKLLPISSDGTVAFLQGRRFLLQWFSCPVIQPSPVRFLRDCLCT